MNDLHSTLKDQLNRFDVSAISVESRMVSLPTLSQPNWTDNNFSPRLLICFVYMSHNEAPSYYWVNPFTIKALLC